MPLSAEARKLLESKGVSGISDPENALRVYVEKEADLANLPSEIEGMSVIGVVSGKFNALQRTGRWRPTLGGISIGHKNISAGTLGCLALDKTTGKTVILSNNHILANSNQGNIGDEILQPGPYDGGTLADQVATLARFVNIKQPPYTNLVDCAIAAPLSDDLVSDEILEIGKIAGIGTVGTNIAVKKSGRTSGLAQGSVFDTEATIKVYGYPFPDEYAIFDDQIITTAIGAPGDSGSVVLTADNRIVGLLFAGSDTLTAVNKIQNVADLLNIGFVVPPVVKASMPAALGAFMLGSILLGTAQ